MYSEGHCKKLITPEYCTVIKVISLFSTDDPNWKIFPNWQSTCISGLIESLSLKLFFKLSH